MFAVSIMYRYLRQMIFFFHYRYATVLYYLNDVKYGGETAFPVVDEITFDEQVGLHFHLNPELSNLLIMHSNQTSFPSPQSNIEINPDISNNLIFQNNFRFRWI